MKKSLYPVIGWTFLAGLIVFGLLLRPYLMAAGQPNLDGIGQMNLLGRSVGVIGVKLMANVLSASVVSVTTFAPSTVTLTAWLPGLAYQPPRYQE